MFKKRLLRIGWSLIWLIVVILLRYQIFFLRLPNRVIVEDANVFLSPANGRIIAIITGANDPVVKNHRVVVENAMKDTWTGSTMVSIMMTPLNVHYQRAPQTSTMIGQHYQTGTFLNAMWSGLDATFQNEYNAMLFETPNHTKFKVIQIAGFLARRIVPMLHIGQSVKQGDIIGLIKMGSQVTIVFDKSVKVQAKVGDTVHEGLTILGTLKN